jgi:hypothetical protein
MCEKHSFLSNLRLGMFLKAQMFETIQESIQQSRLTKTSFLCFSPFNVNTNLEEAITVRFSYFCLVLIVQGKIS